MEVSDLKIRIDGYVRYVAWGSGALAVLGSIMGFLGYQQVRDWAKSFAERTLGSAIDEAVKATLPEVLARAQERAEEHILRVAKLLALRTYQAHDDALIEYGWDGRVATLRTETPILRRALIDCLYSGKRDKGVNRIAAWEAISELLQDDSSIETIRLYLRLATSMRHLQPGLMVYEKFKDVIRTDQDAAVWAATLLRRLGRLKEALNLLIGVSNPADIKALVEIAAIERDLGDFDEAHDRLLPAVNRLASQPSVALPLGWHRVLNTYVANCIDRDSADDGVQAAEFVLRSAPGPVEVQTVGRLVAQLRTDHPKRNALREAFMVALDRLPACEAKTSGTAIARELEGNVPGAVAVLQEAIAERTPEQGKPMPVEVYYWRCSLADMWTRTGAFDQAIDVLLPATAHAYGGEAKFLLALAYAGKRDGKEAARWTAQAADELPKWVARARDNSVLKRIPEVSDFLAMRAQAAHRGDA